MTHLRKMMLEELQRRHYSEATTQRYIRFIERFAQHFHRSPDRLGPQHIREYQAQLFTVHKLTPGSVTNHLCALRFLYIQTLKRPWSIADTPYPKKPAHHSQSGRSSTAHRCRSDPLLSHHLDDPLRHRRAPRRTHAPEGQRHRQPTGPARGLRFYGEVMEMIDP